MKVNKEFLKKIARQKSTWAGILTFVGSAFGLQYVIPAEILAEVMQYIALSIVGAGVGGAAITLDTSKDK